jgi:hypothetical protein
MEGLAPDGQQFLMINPRSPGGVVVTNDDRSDDGSS